MPDTAEFKNGDVVREMHYKNDRIFIGHLPDPFPYSVVYDPETGNVHKVRTGRLVLVPETVTVTVELTREEAMNGFSDGRGSSSPYASSFYKLNAACAEVLQ